MFEKKKKLISSITFFDGFAAKKAMALVIAFFGGFATKKVMVTMLSPSSMVEHMKKAMGGIFFSFFLVLMV